MDRCLGQSDDREGRLSISRSRPVGAYALWVGIDKDHFCFIRDKAVARCTASVVLPTPPFWFRIEIIIAAGSVNVLFRIIVFLYICIYGDVKSGGDDEHGLISVNLYFCVIVFPHNCI